MLATEKMIKTIPPKDAWKDFRKDKRKKTITVVPPLMRILYEFDPAELPEEYLDEFRKRIHYDSCDEYYFTHRETIDHYNVVTREYFREINKGYEAEVRKDALGKAFVELLLAVDDYRAGQISDEEMCKVYSRTRKKLIAAISAKAAAYIAQIDNRSSISAAEADTYIGDVESTKLESTYK